MDQTRMSKQAIDLQKTAFDNVVSSMLFYLDSTQSLSRTLVNQNPWVPEEGKRALVEWMQSNRKVLEDFKQAVDDGYSRMGSCFMSNEGQQRQEQQEHRSWQESQEQQEYYEHVAVS
jgi:hypothetical protein